MGQGESTRRYVGAYGIRPRANSIRPYKLSMEPQARIIEIFSSIQGEGLWVGRPQIFVRFHGCKLKCTFCDTPLTHLKIKKARVEYPAYSKKFTEQSLDFSVQQLNDQLKVFGVSSLALTGGEPLEQADFLTQWLPTVRDTYSILLETSGVEVEAMKQVVKLIDIVSMDIKLPSSSGEKPYWDVHRRFIDAVDASKIYAKIVFDEKITADEINELRSLMKDYPKIEFIFQPVSPLQKRDMKKIFDIFDGFAREFASQARLIPQVHKFLSVL